MFKGAEKKNIYCSGLYLPSDEVQVLFCWFGFVWFVWVVLVWFGLVEVKLSGVQRVGLWDWQGGDKIVG